MYLNNHTTFNRFQGKWWKTISSSIPQRHTFHESIYCSFIKIILALSIYVTTVSCYTWQLVSTRNISMLQWLPLTCSVRCLGSVPSPRGALQGLAPQTKLQVLHIETWNVINQWSFENFLETVLPWVSRERHYTSAFLVLIFIPARSDAAENRSSAC